MVHGPDVDFLIIGAAKSATTWLQKALCRCPDIFMPGPELHYFSREYQRGPEWYAAAFQERGTARILGEKSNSYLTEPQAAQRIRRDFPNVQLIAQLRDPVERAYSDYCMLLRRGEVSRDISRYLDPVNAAGARFLGDGLYASHLERFEGLFDRSSILLLSYEAVKIAPDAQLELAARHVGVTGALPTPAMDRVKDGAAPVVPRPLRRALAPVRPLLDPFRDRWPARSLRSLIANQVEYPPLSDELRQRMAEFFAPDVARLRRYAPAIHRHWRNFSDRESEIFA